MKCLPSVGGSVPAYTTAPSSVASSHEASCQKRIGTVVVSQQKKRKKEEVEPSRAEVLRLNHTLPLIPSTLNILSLAYLGSLRMKVLLPTDLLLH